MRPSAFRFPSPLYPIIDTLGDAGRSHVAIAQAMVRGGARLLQLRVKGRSTAELVEIARRVKQVTDAGGAALIVNDRADVARLIDAAGVHLGQSDLPSREARALLGPEKIIGVSTHNSEQVEAAMISVDADYIGYGPIFATASKDNPDPVQGLDGLRRARERSTLPIVAIGGITEGTMPDALAAGADAVAMIGDLVLSTELETKVRRLIHF
jgi:thiamine-phosphate pyrophosphorylase